MEGWALKIENGEMERYRDREIETERCRVGVIT